MKNREKLLSLLALILAIASGVVAYRFRTDTFLVGLLINLSTTFIGVAIALFLVDVYLDTSRRREAVRPLLRLVQPSIAKNHNSLMKNAFNRFGKPQFAEMLDRYKKNDGDPLALTPDERKAIYSMVKEQRQTLFPLLDRLETELTELAHILGWAFNPDILRDSFACRFAIAQLKSAAFDDSDADMSRVCEHFLDTDLMAFQVHHHLIETLGISKSEVYGNA